MSEQEQIEAVINYFVEEGLDPSYMSYEEIAVACLTALREAGAL